MDKERLIELLITMQKGDLSVFDEFFEGTKRAVFSAAYSVLRNHDLCENVLQDTYLKFLEKIQTISKDKSIISYLMKTAENLALNELKRQKRNVHGLDMTQVIDGEKKKDDELIYEIMRKVLSSDEIQIVLLHTMNDMTHQQIADLLNKPLGTITWAYNNAIKKLRKEALKNGY